MLKLSYVIQYHDTFRGISTWYFVVFCAPSAVTCTETPPLDRNSNMEDAKENKVESRKKHAAIMFALLASCSFPLSSTDGGNVSEMQI